MVNKGLAFYQWKKDIGAVEKYCQEALEINPECEAAVATLGQLSLQQGKIDIAVELFKRQLELTRSESELANALSFMYVSVAQKTFLEVGYCWCITILSLTDMKLQNYPERKQEFLALLQATLR